MSDGHAERVPVSGPCGGCGDGQRDEAGGPWGSAHGAPEHSAVTWVPSVEPVRPEVLGGALVPKVPKGARCPDRLGEFGLQGRCSPGLLKGKLRPGQTQRSGWRAGGLSSSGRLAQVGSGARPSLSFPPGEWNPAGGAEVPSALPEPFPGEGAWWGPFLLADPAGVPAHGPFPEAQRRGEGDTAFVPKSSWKGLTGAFLAGGPGSQMCTKSGPPTLCTGSWGRGGEPVTPCPLGERFPSPRREVPKHSGNCGLCLLGPRSSVAWCHRVSQGASGGGWPRLGAVGTWEAQRPRPPPEPLRWSRGGALLCAFGPFRSKHGKTHPLILLFQSWSRAGTRFCKTEARRHLEMI